MNDPYKMILWMAPTESIHGFPYSIKQYGWPQVIRIFLNSPCTKLNNAPFGIKTQKLGKIEKMKAVEKNSQKYLQGMPLASSGIQKC